MALFKKKVKKEDIPRLPELPKLPELPELPEFPEGENFSDYKTPNYDRITSDDEIPQLPSFPNGALGNKFSQDTIKEAVGGGGDIEDEEPFELELPKKEDFVRKEKIRKPLVKEEEFEKTPSPSFEPRETEEEPIFVRLDKFEEGSKEFEEVKRKVTHIESMFEEVKKVKEREEKELELWKEEIVNIKEKIEKIDKDIFSKLG